MSFKNRLETLCYIDVLRYCLSELQMLITYNTFVIPRLLVRDKLNYGLWDVLKFKFFALNKILLRYLDMLYLCRVGSLHIVSQSRWFRALQWLNLRLRGNVCVCMVDCTLNISSFVNNFRFQQVWSRGDFNPGLKYFR